MNPDAIINPVETKPEEVKAPAENKLSPEQILQTLTSTFVAVKAIEGVIKEEAPITIQDTEFKSNQRFYKKLSQIVIAEKESLIKDIKGITEKLV